MTITEQYVPTRKLTITINHDRDCESPADHDCQWTVHSFCRDHRNSTDADDFIPPNIGLRRKLAVGLAFYLDYYEHSMCRWAISNRWPSPIATEKHDNRRDGVLIWEHKPSEIVGKTYDERRKDASGFLEQYTRWCIDECYGYTIADEDGKVVDSCWGFIGMEYMASVIADHLRYGDEYELTGKFSYVAERYRKDFDKAVQS